MKHAKLAMTLLFLFLGMNILHAQNYNMTNGGSISTCSGTFYDSGGSGGDYGSNETLVYTICPSTPGQAIQVNFTSFDLENSYDNLSIYDGNSTGDRKSTRLNSSHVRISYAVFCLKKKKKQNDKK